MGKYRTCYDNGKYNQCLYGRKANTYELGNLFYGVVPVGIEVRKQLGKKFIFRVQHGNGYYGSVNKKIYQHKYKYFVPSSINNPEGAASRVAFAAAVLYWQTTLTPAEKEEYNQRAIGRLHMSGYNLYIREAMLGQAPS